MIDSKISNTPNAVDFALQGIQCPTASDIATVVSGLDKPITGVDTAMSLATAIVCTGRSTEGLKTTFKLLQQYGVPSLFKGDAVPAFFGVVYRWKKIIGPKPNFGSQMERLFDVLNEYKKLGANWYVTISRDADPAKIASDNWAYLLAYALDSRLNDSQPIAVVIRKFEMLKDAKTGMPLKTIGGLMLFNGDIVPLSAYQMEKASTTDSKTGQPLTKEKYVRYVDIQKLIPNMFL